jgi:ABC-type antimicrobial peptide transport system permease subunit
MSSAPLVSTYNWWQTIVYPEGSTQLMGAHAARMVAIRPNFFQVMGLSILRGRALTPGDGPGAPTVAVITEGIARSLFPNTDPIGRRLGRGWREVQEIEVVGVVRDVGVSTVGTEVTGTIFLSDLQERESLGLRLPEVSFVVRTAGEPFSIVPGIREAVRQIDPDLPISGVTTQVQLIEERLARVRRVAITWVALAATGLLLTCIGLYGLMSYSAARRTHEIGVRMALGAGRFHVVRLVMGQTLALVCLGAVIGAVASFQISQAIRALIFGVTLYDPTTILLVVLLVFTVTAIAGYLPARRASRVDPTVALRYE